MGVADGQITLRMQLLALFFVYNTKLQTKLDTDFFWPLFLHAPPCQVRNVIVYLISESLAPPLVRGTLGGLMDGGGVNATEAAASTDLSHSC